MSARGRPPTRDILTPREYEVLELIRSGLSNREIAERLGISVAGAKFHVSEIISKLGVSGREEAAEWRQGRQRFFGLFGILHGHRAWLNGLPPKVSKAVLVAPVIAVVIGIGGLALSRDQGGDTLSGRSSSPYTAEAESFLQQIPPSPSVEPGDVVHKKTEVWSRFGPKASEIARQSPVTTEKQTIESWAEVGVDNTFVRSYSTTVDGNGRTVQETILRPGDPGMWRTTNVRSGAVMLDRPYQPVKIEHEGRTLADEFHAALADGRGRVISQTSHELVVEQTNPIPREVLARVESLKDQASVPYYWDLDPKATAYTATFRSDGVVLLIEHYAVKHSGEKILVEQWRIVDYAIIDQMPRVCLQIDRAKEKLCSETERSLDGHCERPANLKMRWSLTS